MAQWLDIGYLKPTAIDSRGVDDDDAT
jgi:hypothetical protein